MSNVTLSLKEEILKKGREYAKRHNTSLNNLIRALLEKTVTKTDSSWLNACFKKMDRLKIKSKTKKWKREDLYDV